MNQVNYKEDQRMNSVNYIDHVGFISAIREGVAYVAMIQTSACASCSVKGMCGIPDSETKYLEIPVKEGQWQVGDEVLVRLDPAIGFLAILFGYLIAFVLVLVTLLVSLRLGLSEGRSGLAAIAVLVPYYITLALLRKYFQRKMPLKIMRR